MPSEETIVERLGEIPVLNDGWTSAVDYYSKFKDYNSVTRFTLGIAETSVKKAAEISTPVVGQYKSQIDSVNTYACNKLDELETKYPLIKQPSGEVKEACLDYVQPVVERVKPVVNCMQTVVDTSKKQVDNLKETSTKLVIGAKDLGYDTVTGAVTMTLATPPGRLLTRTVDGALDFADGLVEKYIPEEERDGSDEEYVDAQPESPAAGDNEDSVDIPQMELMEPTPERVAMHFRTVSNKIRRRMFQKAMKDYQGARARTLEALGKLNNHVNLIEYARSNFGNAKTKAEDIWGKIVEERDGGDITSSEQAGLLEENIIKMGRVLMQQVRNGVESLESVSRSAGQFVRHPITKTKEYKELLVHFSSTHSLSEISKATLDNIRSNLNTVSQNVREMVDRVELPVWMGVDIQMENIGLDEDDMINNSLGEPEVVGNHVSS